jgi:hypothetical protein
MAKKTGRAKLLWWLQWARSCVPDTPAPRGLVVDVQERARQIKKHRRRLEQLDALLREEGGEHD